MNYLLYAVLLVVSFLLLRWLPFFMRVMRWWVLDIVHFFIRPRKLHIYGI